MQKSGVGLSKQTSNKQAQKWTSEQIKYFLSIYEQFPSLWDIGNEDYRFRNRKDENYSKMAALLQKHFPDITVATVKAKIRSIRNTYTIEFNKVEKSKINTGSEEEGVYEPTLSWYYEADRFLCGVIKPRSTASSLNLNDGEVQEVEVQDEPFFTSTVLTNSQVTPPIKRIKLEETQDAISMAIQMLRNEEDEFSITARCFALKLKKMSPMQRILADKLINDVLLEGQLGTLTRESTIVVYPKKQNVNSPSTSLPLTPSINSSDGVRNHFLTS